MELFDLIDTNDQVIGVTNKAEAHANRLLHRVVAVFVFDRTNKLLVQVHKKSGGLYDHSVGGHVIKGEDYDTAAKREAREELNIEQSLTKLFTLYSSEGSFHHMFCVYECKVGGDWVFTPNDEVDQMISFDLDSLETMMRDSPKQFTSGFRNTFREYRRLKSSR